MAIIDRTFPDFVIEEHAATPTGAKLTGIRDQAVEKSDRGACCFGAEAFSSTDRFVAGLRGALPGAPVADNMAPETVKICLPRLLSSASGHRRMKKRIPTFDEDIKPLGNAPLLERISRETNKRLGLATQSPRGLN
jgi:hypothetical protein